MFNMQILYVHISWQIVMHLIIVAPLYCIHMCISIDSTLQQYILIVIFDSIN